MQPVKIDGGTQFCTLCEYCILSVIVLGMYATRVMFFFDAFLNNFRKIRALQNVLGELADGLEKLKK